MAGMTSAGDQWRVVQSSPKLWPARGEFDEADSSLVM